MYGESDMEAYIAICKIDSHGNLLFVSGNSTGALYQHKGWDGEGDGREGTCVHLWLIHVDV